MKILFSCDEYPPARTGGIGVVNRIVAEALVQRGHEVFVVGCDLSGTLPKKSVLNGVKVFRIPGARPFRWLQGGGRWRAKWHALALRSGILAGLAKRELKRKQDLIENLIWTHGIDLVELSDYTDLGPYLRHARRVHFRKFSVPTIGRVHGSISFLQHHRTGHIEPRALEMDRQFYATCDHILGVSHFAADFVVQHLAEGRQYDVIPNPIARSYFETLSTSDASARRHTVVFVGKIIETKGAFQLLAAFQQFAAKHPSYRLVMIGGGDIARGKASVPPALRDRVTFTGYVSAQEIQKHLREAAFCVIPTYFETFSVAALEAMLLGGILIFTKEASGPELITDGVDGFLVDPHNVAEIEEKMCHVAEHLDQLADMRQRARDRVCRMYSEQAVVGALEKYYLEKITPTAVESPHE